MTRLFPLLLLCLASLPALAATVTPQTKGTL